MENTGKNGNVQSVERALFLLKIIARMEKPVSVATLSEMSGLNRTTVWRLLNTMEDSGFVERDDLSRGYALGYNATSLCLNLMQQYAPLMRISRPFLKNLSKEVNEDILLAVPRFSGTLTIDQIYSTHGIHVKSYLNQISHVHSSSTGKMLLSYLDEQELDLLLNQPLSKVTPRTIVDPDVIRGQLARIRADGYSYILGENNDGENGICTPVLKNGFPAAFINVCGPESRLTLDRMLSLVPAIRECSRQIEQQLSQY